MSRRWADIEDDDQAPSSSQKWADIEDDFIGRRAVSTNVRAGIRTEVEYGSRPDGASIKITRQFKQTLTKRKTNEAIIARQQWATTGSFGKCRDPEFQEEFGRNTPVQGEEETALQMNKEKALKSSGAEDKFWEQSLQTVESLMAEAKKKRYDANEARRKQMEDLQLTNAVPTVNGIMGGGMGGGKGWGKGLGGGEGGSKYVPPSMRDGKGGDGKDDRRNENTLRVMNLSDDTREGDVQKLFGTCGYVTRVFMPKNREKGDLHKGFAFVQFRDVKEAENAIKKLHGHGYDSLILNVSWAQPKREL